MDTDRNGPAYLIFGILLAILVIGGIWMFSASNRPVASTPSSTTITRNTTVNPPASSPNINVNPPSVNVAPPKVDVKVAPPAGGGSNEGTKTDGGGTSDK